MQLDTLACCGICEIDGISGTRTPEGAMRELGWNLYHGYSSLTWDDFESYAHVIFTQATSPRGRKTMGYGERFAEYIERNKLGVVYETANSVSKCTGNKIKLFVWTPSYKRLKDHFVKLDIPVGRDNNN